MWPNSEEQWIWLSLRNSSSLICVVHNDIVILFIKITLTMSYYFRDVFAEPLRKLTSKLYFYGLNK